MFNILKLPLFLVWKFLKIFIFIAGRIIWAVHLVVSRVFGLFKGIFIGLLGGFGKVGWKSKK